MRFEEGREEKVQQPEEERWSQKEESELASFSWRALEPACWVDSQI